MSDEIRRRAAEITRALGDAEPQVALDILAVAATDQIARTDDCPAAFLRFLEEMTEAAASLLTEEMAGRKH